MADLRDHLSREQEQDGLHFDELRMGMWLDNIGVASTNSSPPSSPAEVCQSDRASLFLSRRFGMDSSHRDVHQDPPLSSDICLLEWVGAVTIHI